MIHLVTAADISYVNEVEGVMSLTNVVLQNQACTRKNMIDDVESLFINDGPRKKIRGVIISSVKSKKNNDALESWRKSIPECKMEIEKQFLGFITLEIMFRYSLLQKMMSYSKGNEMIVLLSHLIYNYGKLYRATIPREKQKLKVLSMIIVTHLFKPRLKTIFAILIHRLSLY